MVDHLLFHSFDSKKDEFADPFYDLELSKFKKLILTLSKKIKTNKYTIRMINAKKNSKDNIFLLKMLFITSLHLYL